MQRLIEKFENKLIAASLAKKDNIYFGGIIDSVYWNREGNSTDELNRIFKIFQPSSLLCAMPAEPYQTIIKFLAKRNEKLIEPQDCETRTFLHDIPVVPNMQAGAVCKNLQKRKGVVLKTGEVISFGSVSPEQAYVNFSSICFACFVKFFSDFLYAKLNGRVDAEYEEVFKIVKDKLPALKKDLPALKGKPLDNSAAIISAMCEVGRKTVEYKLVDSYFGNVSYLFDGSLFISQTGSSLDELEGCIDACPLDGSSCVGITASSEYSAHLDAVTKNSIDGMLHGHPPFAVIMSLYCEDEDCANKGRCHLDCSKDRSVGGIKIVPGEVGTGKYGLCNTLPPAIKESDGAIVYGHGLFTPVEGDFKSAFENLLKIEQQCRDRYFEMVG
jgi:ribulose-5-phosphate 4-epimerase/fuculose-1-phosphate aldolase